MFKTATLGSRFDHVMDAVDPRGLLLSSLNPKVHGSIPCAGTNIRRCALPCVRHGGFSLTPDQGSLSERPPMGISG